MGSNQTPTHPRYTNVVSTDGISNSMGEDQLRFSFSFVMMRMKMKMTKTKKQKTTKMRIWRYVFMLCYVIFSIYLSRTRVKKRAHFPYMHTTHVTHRACAHLSILPYAHPIPPRATCATTFPAFPYSTKT